MKVLITGASGQLGSPLKRKLKERGFDVAAFDRGALDVTVRDRVLEAIKSERPDVIINSAAYTKVDLAETEKGAAFAANRDGARNVAEASFRTGSFIIHISTDFVFDGSKPAPYRETDPANPLSVYGESKLQGEGEVIMANPRHMIVRTSWLYGKEGDNFVKTILRLCGDKETIRVVYDQTGTPTWAEDLAGALVMAVERLPASPPGVPASPRVAARRARGANGHGDSSSPPAPPSPLSPLQPGIYHYSNEGVASWYDFAFEIIEGARGLGFPVRCAELIPILSADYTAPARRPGYSVLDKAKIKRELNIKIPHWKAALEKALKGICGELSAVLQSKTARSRSPRGEATGQGDGNA